MTTRYIGIKQGTDADSREFDYETWITQTPATPKASYTPSADTPIAHFLDQTSEDIGQDRGLIFPETSAQRVMRNKIEGQVAISGDVQVPIYPTGAATLLYYTLGSSTGDNTHVIKSSTPKVFQMSIGKDKAQHRFVGCVVRTLTLDYDPSEVILGTFGIMCRKELETTALPGRHSNNHFFTEFPDYNIAERAFGGVEVDTSIKKGNISGNFDDDDLVTNVESLSVEVDNGFIDDNYVIGDRHLPNAYIQNFTVNGSMELGYDKSSDYVGIVEEDSWRVLMSAKYGTGNSERIFSTELPRIALKTGNLPTEGTDRYLLNVDWEGERIGGSGANKDDLIVVTVKNQETKAKMEL